MTSPLRLLILSHDTVGTRMAGTGIRAWELARALSADVAVTLAAPAPIDIAAPDFACAAYTPGDTASLAALTARADAVLANGHLLANHPELAALPVPLMLDLYDPTPLENLELFRAAPPERRAAQAASDAALLRAQLQAGDAFICATERQRDLYIGGLLALGRVSPARADADPLLRGLIDVVSFGLPSDPPAADFPTLRNVRPGLDAATMLLLWTGGLWDWMDPLTLIHAMPVVLASVPAARLVFLAGRHPGGAVPMQMPATARALAAELGLLAGPVQFYDDWVPYAQRGAFLLEADLLLSLGRPGLESAYAAVRSRFLDHLWAGRASLVSAGDAAAELVARHSLGRVVPPGDVAATAQAIIALLEDTAERQAAAANAHTLAATYSWQQVAAPIRRWLASLSEGETQSYKKPSSALGSEGQGETQSYQKPGSVLGSAGQGETQSLYETIHPLPASGERAGGGAARPSGAVSMDDATRNEAVARLDELWKLQPQPLTSGVPGVGQAKELANSLAKWYVQGIVEQQNAFNAALVHAVQALAANDDRRHSELSLHVNASGSQQRQALALAQKRVEQVAQRLEELARQLGDVDDAQTTMAEALVELRELAAALAPGEEPR